MNQAQVLVFILSLFVFIPTLPLFFRFWSLQKLPKINDTTIAQYEPPHKANPLEAGLIYYGHLDENAIIAYLLYEASKEMVTLKEDNTGLYFNGNNDSARSTELELLFSTYGDSAAGVVYIERIKTQLTTDYELVDTVAKSMHAKQLRARSRQKNQSLYGILMLGLFATAIVLALSMDTLAAKLSDDAYFYFVLIPFLTSFCGFLLSPLYVFSLNASGNRDAAVIKKHLKGLLQYLQVTRYVDKTYQKPLLHSGMKVDTLLPWVVLLKQV